MMLENDDLRHVLENFPPVVYAFAYGSGAVRQGSYDYVKQDAAKMESYVLPAIYCYLSIFKHHFK